MKRLLITGAGGRLGTVLRPRLAKRYTEIKLTDLEPIADLATNETFTQLDLADFGAVKQAMEGMDVVIHFGGLAMETEFDVLLDGNIKGTYNVYEAARHCGGVRVIFASSNHAFGFYERDQLIDTKAGFKADSLYGVSKSFGEVLAQYYYDKFGVQSTLLRIGSCTATPQDYRALATWLSYDDLESLVCKSIDAPDVRCTPIFGVSNNSYSWWDNKHASFLGWKPKDNAEDYIDRDELSPDRVDRQNIASKYQGGPFVAEGHFEDKS